MDNSLSFDGFRVCDQFSLRFLTTGFDGAARGAKNGGLDIGDEPHIVDSKGDPLGSMSGDSSCLANICS